MDTVQDGRTTATFYPSSYTSGWHQQL